MNPLAASIIEDPIHSVGGFEQINSIGQAAHQAWNNLPGNDQGDGTFLHAWTEALSDLYTGIEFIGLPAVRRDADLDGYDDAAPYTRRHLHADFDQHYTHPKAWTKPTDALLASLVSSNAQYTAQNDDAQMAALALNTWELRLAAYEANLAAMLYIKDEAARILGVSVDTDREWFRIAQLADYTIIYDSALLARNTARDNPPWTAQDLIDIQTTIATNSSDNTDAIAAAEALPLYPDQVAALLANAEDFTARLAAVMTTLAAVIPDQQWRYAPLVDPLNLDNILAHSTYSALAMAGPPQSYLDYVALTYYRTAKQVANDMLYTFSFTVTLQEDLGSWRPVRYLPVGSTTWHPATDNLAGTDTYGDVLDSTIPWSIPFVSSVQSGLQIVGPTHILFMSGDQTEWIHMLVSVLNTHVNTNAAAQSMAVLATSRNLTPHNIVMFARTSEMNDRDPMIDITSTWNTLVMYVENSKPNYVPVSCARGSFIFVR